MKSKKVVLISFFDKVCLSTRLLSSVLKKAGHIPYLIYFLEDKSKILDNITYVSKYYQLISNNSFYGFGEDIYTPSNIEFELIKNEILRIDPDVVGFSSRTVSKELCKSLAVYLKSHIPNPRYIAGGYGPTIEPEYFLQFCDFVCIGEGENAIIGLVEKDNPRKTNNVAWVEDGILHHNPLDKPIDLNTLPFTDWEEEHKYVITNDQVYSFHQLSDGLAHTLFASRGCPSKCTYCMASHWPSMYKKFGAKYIPRCPCKKSRNQFNLMSNFYLHNTL